MYFEDLTLCTYSRRATSVDSWNVPLLAIGWLELGHDFSMGKASQHLIQRARKFSDETRDHFPWYNYRGLHACDLCGSDVIEQSNTNLFIPGNACVYMASGGLAHYMERHSYLPPKPFIDALLSCPYPTTTEYEELLILVNGGERPEFLAINDSRKRLRDTIKQRKDERNVDI